MDEGSSSRKVDDWPQGHFGGRSSKDIKPVYLMVACLLLLRLQCGFDEAVRSFSAQAEILNTNFPGYNLTADDFKAEANGFLREQKRWIKELQEAGPNDSDINMTRMWLEYGIFPCFHELQVYKEVDLRELGPLGLFRSVLSGFDEEWKEVSSPDMNSGFIIRCD